jgi:ubiquinone/menaquinone biosynthesis C-methylase UbiE
MTAAVSTEEAIRRLRADPAYVELLRDTYVDTDVATAANRFANSGEWRATIELLGSQIQKASVIDLGAGNGIASRAFALAGAAEVLSVEPDPSDEIGRGAITRICRGLPVRPIDAFGEQLPLPDSCANIVYARQVLHHTRDLERTLRECARVIKPGGIFFACREHVADTPEELRWFLANHPVHQLTQGENAFPLAEYRNAIEDAGLRIVRIIGPWDSVINAFPAVASDAELPTIAARIAGERFGWVGLAAAYTPGIGKLIRRRVLRPRPGRLYSFLAEKP